MATVFAEANEEKRPKMMSKSSYKTDEAARLRNLLCERLAGNGIPNRRKGLMGRIGHIDGLQAPISTRQARGLNRAGLPMLPWVAWCRNACGK